MTVSGRTTTDYIAGRDPLNGWGGVGGNGNNDNVAVWDGHGAGLHDRRGGQGCVDTTERSIEVKVPISKQ